MKNPYDVLGIPYGSPMEKVKEAYIKKSREYTEKNQYSKLEELNEAYDSIVLGGSSYGSYAARDYSDIRDKINSRRLDDAQILLEGIPESERDAQWYYLSGMVYQKRGWLEEAARYFERAHILDPGNDTYRIAYQKAQQAQNGGYREKRSSGKMDDCCCSLCADLICADMFCECLGCDLIPGC